MNYEIPIRVVSGASAYAGDYNGVRDHTSLARFWEAAVRVSDSIQARCHLRQLS